MWQKLPYFHDNISGWLSHLVYMIAFLKAVPVEIEVVVIFIIRGVEYEIRFYHTGEPSWNRSN
jgi:hypothetical protein